MCTTCRRYGKKGIAHHLFRSECRGVYFRASTASKAEAHAKKLADFFQRPVNGHVLLWDGDATRTGHITCERCEHRWFYRSRTMIAGQKSCPGNPALVNEERRKNQAAVDAYNELSADPTPLPYGCVVKVHCTGISNKRPFVWGPKRKDCALPATRAHQLWFDEQYFKWHCANCEISGPVAYGSAFDKALARRCGVG